MCVNDSTDQMDWSTQDVLVLRHLQKYGKITPLEALDRYGVMRLAARIHTLRRKHHQHIATDYVPNGDGHFAEYRLIREPDNAAS